jgi:hypothetical protein
MLPRRAASGRFAGCGTADVPGSDVWRPVGRAHGLAPAAGKANDAERLTTAYSDRLTESGVMLRGPGAARCPEAV